MALRSIGNMKVVLKKGGDKKMKKVLLSLVITVLLASSATIAIAAPGGITDPGVLKDLAAAREATAKYHDVDVAIADGYGISPFAPCVSSPAGGMGFHYTNGALVADPSVDVLTPEILLYIPTKNGGRRLVGVEYFLGVGPVWVPGNPPPPEPVNPPPAPVIFGQEMGHHGELMEPHAPGQPWHYDLHVWLWEGNPDGMFEEFNRNVSCD
jgi:hypothetical protein